MVYSAVTHKELTGLKLMRRFAVNSDVKWFITILLQQETDFFLIRYDLASYVNLVYQHYQNSCRISHNGIV